MKKLAITIAVAVATPAFAADMPVKAPAPMPAPVYNWTGWYVGVNAGASFGNVKTDLSGAPVAVNISNPPTIVGGFSASDRAYPSGFIGGGQIGYNWQYSPLIVVGLEADFQGALERDGGTITNSFSVPIGPPGDLTGSAVTSYQTKIDWFGTVRGRIGYLWGDGAVLTYVTGGLAYGKVNLDATTTVSGIGPGAVFPFSTTHAFSHSELKTGWVVGFGTEGVIDFWGARNWTWKVESLYIDFGDADPVDECLQCTAATSGGLITGRAHFTDGILRGGLNYKFN